MVFVLSSDKKPLNPCSPARARILLKQGKACVFKQYPFTIILKNRWSFMSETEEFRLKIDPGSKVTGVAIVSFKPHSSYQNIVFAGEIEHRGQRIKKKLESRRASRRSRRQRKTRYRKPRFLNRVRTKQAGWLPPSLESRIENVLTWVRRLSKVCPIKAISYELVKFDTQKMDNAEVSGVEYQQGELTGYDIREYLLEKFNRKCVYCGAENVPLEIEHIIPKSNGGSNRVSNLAIACNPCNQKKGNKSIEEFLKKKPEILTKIKRQLKESLKDTAVMNATRWALYNRLKLSGLELETGSGALTKYNRHRLDLPKEHWIDALCVGKSTPDVMSIIGVIPLSIKAVGHGSRQMCSVDKYGFPCSKAKAGKKFFGFQTHDIVKGKNIGRIKGVRVTGCFTMQGKDKDISVNYKNILMIQHADGYSYPKSTLTIENNLV
jgi:5-methylcytosine-specific restriction endonuclease McrA